MFGFSFGELLVISLVTLVAVGPQKLPGMLKTMGQWARKLRKMTLDVRQQTGIDEMLRAEGIQISELRSLMRGYHAPAPVYTPPPAPAPVTSTTRYDDPYTGLEPDPTREYPLEGADSYGALPDDLLEPASSAEVAAAPGAPEPVGAEPPVETTPASPAPAGQESSPEIEPEPELEPAAPPAPVRSAPPPPPSRSGAPRPPATPPPPPRRSVPPRPEPSSPVNKPEASAADSANPSSGSANGNG